MPLSYIRFFQFQPEKGHQAVSTLDYPLLLLLAEVEQHAMYQIRNQYEFFKLVSALSESFCTNLANDLCKWL